MKKSTQYEVHGDSQGYDRRQMVSKGTYQKEIACEQACSAFMACLVYLTRPTYSIFLPSCEKNLMVSDIRPTAMYRRYFSRGLTWSLPDLPGTHLAFGPILLYLFSGILIFKSCSFFFGLTRSNHTVIVMGQVQRLRKDLENRTLRPL